MLTPLRNDCAPSLNVIISANARFHFCCTFPFMTFDHNDHSTNNSRTHGMINKCFYRFVEDTEGNTLSKSELPSSTGSRDIDLGSRRLELCSAARRATLSLGAGDRYVGNGAPARRPSHSLPPPRSETSSKFNNVGNGAPDRRPPRNLPPSLGDLITEQRRRQWRPRSGASSQFTTLARRHPHNSPPQLGWYKPPGGGEEGAN